MPSENQWTHWLNDIRTTLYQIRDHLRNQPKIDISPTDPNPVLTYLKNREGAEDGGSRSPQSCDTYTPDVPYKGIVADSIEDYLVWHQHKNPDTWFAIRPKHRLHVQMPMGCGHSPLTAIAELQEQEKTNA